MISDLTDYSRGTTFLIGPFIGPALAGYIGAGSNWKVSFGILTVFYGISTILIFVFGYETYFVKGRQCQRNSRLQSILGIKNHNLPVGRTLGYWTKLLAIYIFKLPLLLTGIATMVNFCWPIGMLGFCSHLFIEIWFWSCQGITVTVSTFVAEPPYLFNTVQSASLRWAPIIGGLIGTHSPHPMILFSFFFLERKERERMNEIWQTEQAMPLVIGSTDGLRDLAESTGAPNTVCMASGLLSEPWHVVSWPTVLL